MRAGRAASIRTGASPTWIWTGSTPPFSIRAWVFSPAPCTILRWRARCAAPTTAGSPITASPVPIGWIAPWLDRMDRHFDDQGFNDSGLKTRPSELFKRNCWISFEPVEGSLNVLADYVGPNKIMWATDYPHRDGFFPGAPDMVRERL